MALAILLCPVATQAQQSLQVPVQFDFLNPSARSLALGGAFVGLADDATAALVNPAGLIALSRKEASVEGRYRRFTQPFLVGGRLSGPVTGMGQDTVAGPVFDDIVDQDVSASFLSFVYPRGKLRLAAFRHELIRVDQDFESIGVFQNRRGFENRDTGATASRTLAIDSYGGSVAYEAPHVWIGGGVMAQHFSLGFEFERFVHPTNMYLAPDPTQRVFQFSQSGGDTALGAVVGVMVPLPKAKIGLAYKRGATFDFSSTATPFPFSNGSTTSATFKTPDTLALGASAMTLNDSLLFTGEYTRVFHSQLRSEYVEALASQGESADRVANFTIDGAHEVHFGAEYILPVARHPGIRAGFWFDPDHSVHFTPTAANDLLDERLVAMLSSGKNLWHYTFGGMVAVHSKVDLSGAVDYSSRSTLLSLSIIWATSSSDRLCGRRPAGPSDSMAPLRP